MKKVFSSQQLPTISHFKNLLESHGIACIIKNFYLTGGIGELPPTECWPELWILDDAKYLEAQTLLAQNLAGEATEKPWKCARCGEQLEAQFTECWKCGGHQPA